jgi:hypothetical protein
LFIQLNRPAGKNIRFPLATVQKASPYAKVDKTPEIFPQMSSFKTTTAWDGRANIFSSPLCEVILFTVEVKYHRDCLVLQANENRRRGSSDTITNIYYSGGSTSTRPGHETIYVDNEREAILNEKLDTDEFLPAMHSWQPLPQVVAKKIILRQVHPVENTIRTKV